MSGRDFNLVARKVEDLIPYDRNSRTHNEAQVAQLAASIKEFGFTNPVLIDEQNTIIAGEGRVLAAKKVKLEAVACIVLAGLTEAQKAAYVIADNKLALNAGWDADKLFAELGRISDLDFELHLTGFSEVEVMALIDDAVPGVADATATGSEGTPGTEIDWNGMPEFHQPSNKPFRSIVMHFNDQKSVDTFAQKLEKNVTDRTKYLWYPEHTKNDNTGVAYE